MKKSVLILLAFFYLMSSSGLMVCVGKCAEFFQSSLSDSSTNGCCQKMAHPSSNKGCAKGCCKTTKCMVKLQTSQQLSAKYEWAAKAMAMDLIHNAEPLFFQAPELIYQVLILPDYHAPPSQYKNPLYLFNRVLLI